MVIKKKTILGQGPLDRLLKKKKPKEAPAPAPTPTPAPTPEAPAGVPRSEREKAIREEAYLVSQGDPVKEQQLLAERGIGVHEGLRAKKELEQETIRRQEVGAQLAQQVGQLSPEIQAQIARGEVDIGQVLGAGAAAAVPGIVGGAAVGAIAGGVGAIPGAIIGGVGTFIAGARSNLKSQQQGKIQAGAGALSDGERNLRKFITAANSDPANHPTYLTLFNEQLSYIERDYGILQLDTDGYLKDLSGADGTPQLADYARFYQPNGARDFYALQMQMALANPNPSKVLITPEDMME